jgi:hypothetical protein
MWQSGLFMKLLKTGTRDSLRPLPHGRGSEALVDTAALTEPRALASGSGVARISALCVLVTATLFAQQPQPQQTPPVPALTGGAESGGADTQQQPADVATAQQESQAPPQQPQTQTQPQLRPQPNPPSNRPYGLTGRYYFGFRVEFFPLSLFKTSFTQSTTTTPPVASYSYFPSNGSQKAALAATFEYMFTPRLSAGADFYLTHAKYTLTTQVRSGLPGPNSGVDDRPLTTYAESSNADYWVFPMLARYGGVRPRGFLSHLYVAAGAEYRHVGRVRTGTDIYYPDGTTSYTEIAAVPTNSNQIGGVIGLGLRMLDDLGIKVAPEIRFIRWTNSTFEGPGYHSQMDQAEAGLGFSF